MNFHDFEEEQRFRKLWDAVSIEREVPYSLFTFGVSDLPYYLIVDAKQAGQLVEVSRGEVTVNRPSIITPYNAQPELRNFFEDEEQFGIVDFIMSRSAAFSHLKIENKSQKSELVSDSVEELVAKLNSQLDDEEEDRVAILSAPFGLGKMAVFRYTTQRIMSSASDNLNELRERGFLPD